MAFQTVFRRYEVKYLLSREQKSIILKAMESQMKPDPYGRCTIRNLYFDTKDYRLIRRSMEKPLYKEKLRIRCYELATEDSTVFVELKKKYDSVVYKRRLPLRENDAMAWVTQERSCPVDTQISREINYFIQFYQNPLPSVYLSYDREAYYASDCNDFRITFDDHILYRQSQLSLCTEPYGTPILPKDTVLMELKSSGGIPLWLTKVLSEERIYKASFSKYAMAYQNILSFSNPLH